MPTTPSPHDSAPLDLVAAAIAQDIRDTAARLRHIAQQLADADRPGYALVLDMKADEIAALAEAYQPNERG